VIPFTDFLYFGVSLYALTPAVIAGFLKRGWRVWLIVATLGMLLVQYPAFQSVLGAAVPELALVVGYALLEWVVTILFLAVRRRGVSRAAFYVALIFNLLPLIAGRIGVRFDPQYPLVFIGLSYLTFRVVDATIGIHDGLIKEVDPLAYLSFLLFFPTISSGPIDRYRRFERDWRGERERSQVLQDLDSGIHRIFTGFLYKFILAALIRQYWLDPVSQGSGFLQIVSYMYAYTLYLFFDFAGYSAFAIGFSNILGIHTPENFNRPFLSRDIREFWQRWHMSLSFWLRDHIYNRFIFSALKGKWFKSAQVASYLGLLITMGVMGFWHGFAWNYIVYGFYHGVLMVATTWFDHEHPGSRLLSDQGLFWRGTSVLLTFHAVALSFLIFSGRLF